MFSDRYLETSGKILTGTGHQRLPEHFIQGISEALKPRPSAQQSSGDTAPSHRMVNPLRAPPEMALHPRGGGRETVRGRREGSHGQERAGGGEQARRRGGRSRGDGNPFHRGSFPRRGLDSGASRHI
ncbi:hypothetical protein BJY01DRAFT_125246 [Aspergillus pseudoustus]|uniref:Uncharacterized protein n=1 Tax=Aspergillus pseudoustus TaxID=1810923 RepID=A0ABR4INF2_9EURO